MDLSYAAGLKNEIEIPVYIGGVNLIIRLDAGFFSPAGKTYAGLHNHSLFEIHLVLDGTHSILIHNRLYTINAGDICFISPGVYHYYGKIPDRPAQIRTFKLIIPAVPVLQVIQPEKSEHNKRDLNSIESEVVINALTEKKFAVFTDSFCSMNLIPEILRELDEKAIGYFTNVQALFMRMIINLVRSVAQSQMPDYHIRDRIPEEIRNELIDGFFYHNYHQDVSADDLADVARISRRQLHRVLKELYNLSFKQKLLETRLEMAKDLLRNTSLPIEIIAEKVGYLISANFYSIFKKSAGISPGSYRRISRKDAKDSAINQPGCEPEREHERGNGP